MPTTQIPLPDKLDSKKHEEWKLWIERFQCYRIAAGLDEKDDKVQINTLVYAMSGNANDILKSFNLSSADYVYDTVIQSFASHFVGRSNVIFERARFNKRVQGERELIIDVIEALNGLAETCQFGTLKEELIRDRIVVGIRNAQLSQRLMQDEKLTLDKAVKEAKSSELIKQHHEILKGDGEDEKINRVQNNKRRPSKASKPFERERQNSRPQAQKGNQCYRSGKSPPHKREDCPANNATCLKCRKQGYYAVVCKSKKVREITEDLGEEASSRESEFLGTIESEESKAKWFVNLSLGKIKVRFKIDTGAYVTVIPKSVYLRTGITNLKATSKVLFGPGQEKLLVKGLFKAKWMTESSKETLQDIYILENLEEAFLGRPAIDTLGLVQKVDIIQSDDSSIEKEVKATYPNLFKGLGELEGEVNIKLQPDVKPFALTTQRRVALPFLKKVKEELERMEKLGVISKVDVPTDWCAGVVVVPKPDGRIRICVDLTKLNKSVL